MKNIKVAKLQLKVSNALDFNKKVTIWALDMIDIAQNIHSSSKRLQKSCEASLPLLGNMQKQKEFIERL